MKMVVKMVLVATLGAPALGCGTTGEVAPTGPTQATPGEVPVGTPPPPTTENTETLTPDQCVAKGGETIGDRGDGSTRRNGCPNSRKLLGNVRIGIEGGICCSK